MPVREEKAKKMLKDLVSGKADLMKVSRGTTFFIQAVKTRNIPLIKSILSRGEPFNINYIGEKDNKTALMAALDAEGSVECAKLFIDHPDMDVHLINDIGENALHYASRGRVEGTKILLERKVDPNQKDNKGNTPVFNACNSLSPGCIDLFLSDERSDFNAKGFDGTHPIERIIQFRGYNALKKIGLHPNRDKIFSGVNLGNIEALASSKTGYNSRSYEDEIEKTVQAAQFIIDDMEENASNDRVGDIEDMMGLS